MISVINGVNERLLRILLLKNGKEESSLSWINERVLRILLLKNGKEVSSLSWIPVLPVSFLFVSMKAKTNFLRCIGYLSFTKDHTKLDLLQIRALVLLLNFLNY